MRGWGNFSISIRWKMVAGFLAVLALAFVTINLTSLRMMEDYMLNQRVQEEQRGVDRLAASLAAPLWEGDAEALFAVAAESGRESGGRVLVLDGEGVVQIDPYSLLNGRRLDFREVASITEGGNDRDYGFHQIQRADDSIWAVYYTALITYEGQGIGVVLFSMSVQDVVEQVESLRAQMMLYMAVVALLAAGLGFVITTLFVRPFSGIMQVTQQIARGRFDRRLTIGSRDELGQLAQSFNVMSERLENLDKTRNEFVSNASHELKTPLSAIKVLVESLLFEESGDLELYREFLRDINNEIDRLNAIIQSLLTLVRMDRQEAESNIEPVEMETLLRETLKPLARLAAQKQIYIDIVAFSVDIMGDPLQLQQIIINLVDNAIKYTQEYGRIRVQLWQEGAWCKLSVSDDGPGIPPESIDRLFERFYRVDKARARATGGTGLGLSIVQRIVSLHNGEITVESKEGQGTTFQITLPAIEKRKDQI